MKRAYLVLVLLFVAACAPRAQIVLAPEAAVNPVRPVFVATSRDGNSGIGFSNRRAPKTRFARYDIAVPPDRAVGEISWPRGPANPATDFVATKITPFEQPSEFRSSLTNALAVRPEADREAVIYVHGFNNNFADGVLRITQLAHDFDLPGVAVHYSWPSAGNPLAYAYDRDSVLFARDGLEDLVREVKGAGARRIVLVAHSVGAQIVMEVLRQMAIAQPGLVDKIIDGVVLISPDIDIDVFRSQVARIGVLPDPFGIFVSRRDKVLTLSARLTGQRNRLGNVESVDDLADLKVTLIDVSEFSQGAGHFTLGSSAAVISIFARAGDLETAFKGDRAGRSGLIPGTILTVQNATAIILLPVTGLTQ